MDFNLKYGLAVLLLLPASGCQEVLNPKPTNVLSSDIVLTSPEDVPAVRLGLYNSLRGTAALSVVAGDLTADLASHNGTFTVYNELGNKQISSANDAAASFWASVYNTVYLANFIEERLPRLTRVPARQRNELLAEASLVKGYVYFIGANTFGDIPFVTGTSVDANRNIARTPRAQVLDSALRYVQGSLSFLPDSSVGGPGFASKDAAKALLARLYLYRKDWQQAETYATQVIGVRRYRLEAKFPDVVNKEFDSEAVLEMAYGNTSTDDPGTSTFGLNNIFVGRREVIPSNAFSSQIFSPESGERSSTIRFNPAQQRGNDNGFSVRKYGTVDEGNNNITLFRLAEMYLIRAEARVQQAKLTDAAEDINVLRRRAKAPTVNATNQADMLLVIERERLYELAFEGHRWYDLVRTGRAKAVMSAFSPNWKDAYERWPVPQTEIQRNPALAGAQNPGY